jgi:hypothetical protein
LTTLNGRPDIREMTADEIDVISGGTVVEPPGIMLILAIAYQTCATVGRGIACAD